MKPLRCSLAFSVNFTNKCHTGFKQFPCVVQIDGAYIMKTQRRREKVWLPFVSSPFAGTVDTTANTVIIPVPNCKRDGRKLNHSSSTLTRKEKNNCMATCCSNYLCKMGQSCNRKVLGILSSVI